MFALIADDQPEFVQSISRLVKNAGFVIELATDSQSALDRMASRTFDLILTDLQMPPGNWGDYILLNRRGRSMRAFRSWSSQARGPLLSA